MPRVTARSTLPALMFATIFTLACKGAPRTADVPADSPAAGGAGETSLRTDRDEYRVIRAQDGAIQLTINATYHNRTAEQASIQACHTPHPPVLQKRVENAWVDVYNPPVLMCITPPVVIPAGERYEYEYRISAYPRGGDTFPQFEAESVPGTYRLRWMIREAGTGTGTGQSGTDQGVISNEFRLVE